jgi:type II secretory ATPase GspE/PulE/Tfp pilus assembly ATPase PilB-like protein
MFKNVLSQPYGLILSVGPTGVGKTTTLHSALRHINLPDRKIWTVEDPVEIIQTGLRQVQVHAKIGVTFSEILRSFLRADPDIIMIGEMRDQETAKIAVEAALTGHLVLSTLHTNSAPETIIRLIEMGIDQYSFADSLLAVLAQRLARSLCEKCKEPYHPSQKEYNDLVNFYDPCLFDEHKMPPFTKELTLMRKVGCKECAGTGYKGRIALHELLTATENTKDAIRRKNTADEIRALSIKEGMRTLQMDGIIKIFQGNTDLEQIKRVCRSQTVTEVC